MDFKEMCLKAGMKKVDAEQYAACVDASNKTDMLLMLHVALGMIKDKEAMQYKLRLERDRQKRESKK